jgi:dihydroorotate dehydrogenase (fumarate)
MADLSTQYLGLKLKNPLVASPSPFTETADGVKRLEDAGVSAVVLYSLFEEQIIRESEELDHYLTAGTDSFAEAQSYLPDAGKYSLAPDKYLEHLAKVKKAVKIPVLGSLNGVSTGGWVKWAKKIEEAGADALELNIYFMPTDPAVAGRNIVSDQVSLVRDVKAQIKIPLAVKLSPFYTAMPNVAQQFAGAGAAGLVLFNRFYQPDINLEKLEVEPNLQLSRSEELRLPLRWIAILADRVKCDFALSSGLHTGDDLAKAILVGASVGQVTSALLKHGPGRVKEILDGYKAIMEQHEYKTVAEMKGAMCQKRVGAPAAYERANYMKVLGDFKALP